MQRIPAQAVGIFGVRLESLFWVDPDKTLKRYRNAVAFGCVLVETEQVSFRLRNQKMRKIYKTRQEAQRAADIATVGSDTRTFHVQAVLGGFIVA